MNYVVIGDSHECVNELRRLITKIEKEIPGVLIIHVGDYVDKGNNTQEMVEYMLYRVSCCEDIVLPGNHESFVYKRLKGQTGPLEDPVREAILFGSRGVFLEQPLLANRFLGMYEDSLSYPNVTLWKSGAEREAQVFINHAPCRKEYLGKTDTVSLREQRNYRTRDRFIPTVEDLKWFYDEADETEPLHIFGHMAHSGKTLEECRYKNKIFLDTGCVYGNGLSAVHIRDGKVVKYYFEPSDGNRQPHDTLPPPLGLR